MLKYARWFWRYYRNHKRALLVLLTLSFVTSALVVIQPILLKNIFDLLQSGETRTTRLPYVDGWINSLGHGSAANYAIMLVIFGLAALVTRTILVGHRAYLNIKPEGKTKAGVILIISGVITLILGGVFGIISGIFFIIAGALTVSWKPYKDELLTPTARTTDPIIEPSEVKPVTTQKGSQFCASCGAQLIGDEQFCPVCGTAIS